jgi:hypothetical protein
MLNPSPDDLCGIARGSGMAQLMQKAVAIVWDEFPTAPHNLVRSVDRTLRDIREQPHLPFGGLLLFAGGDFR